MDAQSPDTAGAACAELCALLAPLLPDEFISHYWLSRPLYLKGAPDKFSALFNRARFDAAAQRAWSADSAGACRLHAMMPTDEEDLIDTPMTMEQIGAGDIEALLAAGISVCLTDVGCADPGLADFALKVKHQMQYTGNVRFNSYLSPAWSGADMHFDARVSTTLQIEGRKRWVYATRPSITWPVCNAQLGRDGSVVWANPWAGHNPWEKLPPMDEVEFTEVVLEPGDLLCLPAGTWHDVKATGTGSLALNLSFGPPSLSAWLAEILAVELAGEDAWRAGPPPVPASEREAGIPVSVAEYLAARLQEAAAFLASYEANTPVAYAAWRRLIR